MKRLIRANKYQNFMEEWWNHWGTQRSQAEQFISENPDCIYNGEAYRSLGFKNLSSVLGDIDLENGIDYITLQDKIRKMIKSDSKVVSWSYEYSSVDNFANEAMELDYELDIEIIIRANISGLDIDKFVNKYSKEIDQNYMEGTDMETEVIAKMVSSFEIEDILIRDTKNGIMQFNDDNPSIIKSTDTGYSIDYDN
jgi:hypothetical protein